MHEKLFVNSIRIYCYSYLHFAKNIFPKWLCAKRFKKVFISENFIQILDFSLLYIESSLTECPTNSPVLTKKACLDVEHANSVVNPTKNACNASNETIMLDDEGKYKGAHWYRSSAVLLNYHK